MDHKLYEMLQDTNYMLKQIWQELVKLNNRAEGIDDSDFEPDEEEDDEPEPNRPEKRV